MAETIQSLDQLSTLKPATPEAPKYVQKLDTLGRAYATGKRKDAVARVWLKRGAGKIVVNDREFEVYFARPVLRMMIEQPLTVANRGGQYDVICRVSGGGLSGPGRRGAPRALQGAHQLRAGAARRAQARRLPHPRLPRRRAQEVRQGQGPALVPVLEALSYHETCFFHEVCLETGAAGPRFFLRERLAGPRGAVEEQSMPYRTDTFRIAMSGPADVSKLTALIEQGALDPATIVAILVKTEGNGGVNDFTREYTCTTLATSLAPYLRATPAEVERRIAMVVSGGTEGVLSPHATIFARRPTSAGSPNGEKRLAIGIAATRDFEPHEIGRAAQIEATAAAVKQAMRMRDRAHRGRALGAGEVPAAHGRAHAGGGPRRPQSGDGDRL